MEINQNVRFKYASINDIVTGIIIKETKSTIDVRLGNTIKGKYDVWEKGEIKQFKKQLITAYYE